MKETVLRKQFGTVLKGLMEVFGFETAQSLCDAAKEKDMNLDSERLEGILEGIIIPRKEELVICGNILDINERDIINQYPSKLEESSPKPDYNPRMSSPEYINLIGEDITPDLFEE